MGGLDPAKRKGMVDLFGDDFVKALEEGQEEAAKVLEAQGVDSKEAKTLVEVLGTEQEDETEGEAGEEAKPEPKDTSTLGVKELAEALSAEFGLTELHEGIKTMREGMEERFTALEASVKALERTDDEKVAETIKPEAGAKWTGAFEASKSDSNGLEKSDGRTKEVKEAQQGPTLADSEENAGVKGQIAGLIGVAGLAGSEGA